MSNQEALRQTARPCSLARLPHLDAVAKLMSLGGSSETRMTVDPPHMISSAEAKALGLKHFFTGKPCKHGHVAERCVGNYACMECDRTRARLHYAKNKVRILSERAAKRAADPRAR